MKSTVRLARCPGGDCLLRVTCLRFRAVELVSDEPDIDPVKRIHDPGAGCGKYVRIVPGAALRSWKTDPSRAKGSRYAPAY